MVLLLFLDLLSVISFAVSGAMAGVKQDMDVFGVITVSLTASFGGGILRDILLGKIPPSFFTSPYQVIVCVLISLSVFQYFYAGQHEYESDLFNRWILILDSIGLGLCTSSGVLSVIEEGYGDNPFFAVTLAVIAGVGGGVLCDLLTVNHPYIFVKDVYASASLAGAIVSYLTYLLFGETAAMIVGAVVTFAIRMLAIHFHWNLPKVTYSKDDTE